MRALLLSFAFVGALLLSPRASVAGVSFFDLTSRNVIDYIEMNRPEFSSALTDARQRNDLCGGLCYIAMLNEKVENRPLAFSLCVDLYNSLPPDLLPPPMSKEELEQPDADYHEQREWPLKFQASEQLVRYVSRSNQSIQEQWYTLKGKPVMEPVYLAYFIRDHIPLDKADAPPSISKIDLNNPTHYLVIAKWMAEQSTAMTQGVSPTEAVTWTTQHCAEWKGCDKLSDWSVPVTATSTVTATATPESAPAVAQEPAPEVATEATDSTIPQARLVSRSYGWMWGVVILVAVALGGAVVVRRRKK